MSKKKTIIRKAHNKENPYSQISRTILQDKNLSWKTTGMLAYLLSLPNNWEVNVVDLSQRKTDGKQSTRTVLKELIRLGYAIKNVKRDDKGRFTSYEYIVFETKTYPLSTFRKMDTSKETSTRVEDYQEKIKEIDWTYWENQRKNQSKH